MPAQVSVVPSPDVPAAVVTAVVVVAAAIIAALLGLLGCVVYYWGETSIRVASPHFLVLMLLGCCVQVGSVFPLALPSDLGCMLFPALFSLGFSLMLLSVFIKVGTPFLSWNILTGKIIPLLSSALSGILF